jgi:hypothetical protein
MIGRESVTVACRSGAQQAEDDSTISALPGSIWSVAILCKNARPYCDWPNTTVWPRFNHLASSDLWPTSLRSPGPAQEDAAPVRLFSTGSSSSQAKTTYLINRALRFLELIRGNQCHDTGLDCSAWMR